MNIILKEKGLELITDKIKKRVKMHILPKTILQDIIKRENLYFFSLLVWMTCSVCFLYFFDKSITTGIAVKVSLYSLMFAFALFLILLFSGSAELILKLIFIIIIILPSALVVPAFVFTGSILHRKDFRIIFSTNLSEAGEFITQFSSVLNIGSILAYIMPLVLFFKFKPSVPVLKKRLQLFLILTVSISAFWVCRNDWHLISKRFHVIDFYRSYYDFTKEKQFDEWRIKRQKLKFSDGVISDLNTQKAKTFVLIIGESLSRNHMQLYGYGRETNPELSSMMDQLYIFKDVVSPATITMESMKYILTFADHDHPEYFFEKRSIVNLFNDAGYETVWIGNQNFRGNRYNIGHGIIARECKKTYEIAGVTDQAALDAFKVYIESEKGGNRLVIIHLRGSHTKYNTRYPDSFKFFNHELIPIPYRNIPPLYAKKVIDEYDNSVRFNDHIIYSIIETVKKRNEYSWVLYFSDHGEELFEFRNFFGHQEKNFSRYMCEIPFILWASDSLKSSRKEFFKNLPEFINRPYSTENVIHSISEISGLRCRDLEYKKSIFSQSFVKQERIVNSMPYTEIQP